MYFAKNREHHRKKTNFVFNFVVLRLWFWFFFLSSGDCMRRWVCLSLYLAYLCPNNVFGPAGAFDINASESGLWGKFSRDQQKFNQEMTSFPIFSGLQAISNDQSIENNVWYWYWYTDFDTGTIVTIHSWKQHIFFSLFQITFFMHVLSLVYRSLAALIHLVNNTWLGPTFDVINQFEWNIDWFR